MSLTENIDNIIEKNHEIQGLLLQVKKNINDNQDPHCESCNYIKAQFEKIKLSIKCKKNQTLYDAVINIKKDGEDFKEKYYKLKTKYNKMVELYGELPNEE